MSRRHADPVDVVRRDDAPEQFLWRDRLYLVRDVLAHWTETGAWWDGATARAATAGDGPGSAAPPRELVLTPIPSSPRWAQRAWGEPAPDLGGVTGGAALEEQEREFWRVEAGSGRVAAAQGGTGVYDLCFDWSCGQWSLSRVVD